MTEYHNPNCPDYSSHEQNAADRLGLPYGDGARRLTQDEADACDAMAQAEYRACEGH